MPKYPTSDGQMLTKQTIDRKVTQAKKQKVQDQFDEWGYNFCERTGRSNLPTDVSHIISVRMCQAEGMSELAYNQDNLEILTREEHMVIESWKHHKRKTWYEMKMEGMAFDEFEIYYQRQY